MSPVRVHRLDPSEPISSGRPIFRPRTSFSVAARATAGARLDLGARIALAADIQASAGNRAMAHVAGFARADHKTPPPGGIKDIGEAAHSPGNRGFTQSRYTANPPLFRPGKNDPVDGAWEARPASVRLPELDFDVWWPAPGRHRLGNYGKGGWYLDVTEEWSDKLRQGEEEHVTDTEKAYSMTWGKVASIVNEMAAARSGSKGGTVEAANQAAWKAFVDRLPKGFKPAGETYSTEGQEAVWGADDKKTVFRQLMNETKAVRDGKLWHHPEEAQKASTGDDLIYEMSAGNSHIGETTSETLIGDAWKRLTESK
jgi:hypothetical protein